MESYPKANERLYELLFHEQINEETEEALRAVEDINAPIVVPPTKAATTYLCEMTELNYVKSVRFLLQHGADPNYNNDELLFCCAWNDLCFAYCDTQEEAKKRYEIAKMFLEYGADPDLLYDGDTVFDYVTYEVYNDELTEEKMEYLRNFYKLLVCYGGGHGKSRNNTPKISEEIDFSRIDEYRIEINRDGGFLISPDGRQIGIL